MIFSPRFLWVFLDENLCDKIFSCSCTLTKWYCHRIEINLFIPLFSLNNNTAMRCELPHNNKSDFTQINSIECLQIYYIGAKHIYLRFSIQTDQYYTSVEWFQVPASMNLCTIYCNENFPYRCYLSLWKTWKIYEKKICYQEYTLLP